MFDCHNLLHPFQNDPGTSQRQRIIDQLLSENVKIDNRSLADLLDYFYKLSGSIHYYDKTLAVSDWRPFFQHSLPFVLSSIARFDHLAVSAKFDLYKYTFNKQPSVPGLQLMIYFVYYNGINTIYKWYEELRKDDLPARTEMESLIRNKLSGNLLEFIQVVSKAVKNYGIKPIDFSKFLDTAENDVWNLQLPDLYSFKKGANTSGNGKCADLKKIYSEVIAFWQIFLDGIRSMATPAEQSIGQSFVPLAQELREQHAPHLALIFAFIRLFGKMQGELNKKTREHLKFFYSDVLRIKAKEAGPDKANIIFEVQKILRDQYQKHRLVACTPLNGGRDNRNFDMLFDTDDEIVVNETQVAEVRTLFLKNEEVIDATFLEGVYIAPAADKADGVEKDFKDEAPKNWYTLGNKFSKYTAPGKKDPQAHPAARLGFMLASPVLFLGGGTRKVDITIDCELTPSVCNDREGACGNGPDCPDYPDDLYSATSLYNRVKDFLTDYTLAIPKPMSYYLVSRDLLAEAVQQGMSVASADMIRNQFLGALSPHPCSNAPRYVEYELVDYKDWNSFMNAPLNVTVKTEVEKLPHLFQKKWPFKITFSGEDEWIEASEITSLEMGTLTGNRFQFVIAATLNADKPAVTFYNKENLEEDFGTELPLVRLELEDIPGLRYEIVNPVPDENCCLKRKQTEGPHYVSLYHFFRNVTVKENTKIDVEVCGLKNFVVQNDENLMDVNSLVYPFGTRPDVPSFDMINPNPAAPQALGPNFFIGSKEIFCKKWSKVVVNIKWKDKPVNFNDYYKGYKKDKITGRFGLDEDQFEYRLSFLSQGNWKDEANNRKLFETLIVPMPNPAPSLLCDHNSFYEYAIIVDFPAGNLIPSNFTLDKKELSQLDVNTREGFIKLNLRKQDFGHKNYAFVLARQMMAYSKLPKETIESAVYYDAAGDPIVIDFGSIYNDLIAATTNSGTIKTEIDLLNADILPDQLGWNWDPFIPDVRLNIRNIVRGPAPLFPTPHPGIVVLANAIKTGLEQVNNRINTDNLKEWAAVIPNEPWTPIVSNILLDYTATATISDIDLIHLYPYKGTHKQEEIELEPTLFPTFCDEGTLFIGLRDFQPSINLNMLFQLAEATADSEKPKEKVHWHYLDNNRWRKLRTGFEVLEDGTSSLTTSGIIKFALPENMTNNNSIMPPGIFWIKASIAKSSRAVSETLGIHTQAIRATFKMNEGNDTARLDKPLEAGSIGKLLLADPLIKKVEQTYDSFGGSIPELDGGYYLRVSERLRHKGRSVQKWDYERIVLQEFPQVYKTKCVNHSFHTDASLFSNDVPYAPGYVLLAVIPDLRILKAGNSFEPKVPVSLMETIENFIRKTTSPFVRLKVANPRYEKVNFCISVTLVRGKDENYYKEKLKSDLREFLAPWAVGKYDKLTFGQCIYRSDVLRFLELTGYVDFISELRMAHQDDSQTINDVQKICPVSPRSILVGGDIEVKIIKETCDSWCKEPKLITPCPGPVLVQDYCRDKK